MRGKERPSQDGRFFVSVGTIDPLPRLLILTGLPLILVAACSREAESAPTIPSATDLAETTSTTIAETTTTASRLSVEEASLRFTACMRKDGIDMPDIRFDAYGRPVLGELADELDITSAQFLAALDECSDILTAAGATDLRADPEFQAVIQDQLQAFSECMRDEGVEDFPDPVAGFTGSGPPYPLNAIPFSDPGFADALETCQEKVAFPGLGG